MNYIIESQDAEKLKLLIVNCARSDQRFKNF